MDDCGGVVVVRRWRREEERGAEERTLHNIFYYGTLSFKLILVPQLFVVPKVSHVPHLFKMHQYYCMFDTDKSHFRHDWEGS